MTYLGKFFFDKSRLEVKRLKRDPLTFDLFELLSIYAQQRGHSLSQPETITSFLGVAKDSSQSSLANQSFVYGKRTESMFEALVAALGKIELIKTEDCGDIFTREDDLAVPDFRLVMADNSQFLVEVKNFAEVDKGVNSYELKREYLEALMKYSRLLGVPLLLAIYWVRWNLWTLVSPEVFQQSGSEMTLPFGEALRMNRMFLVGDLHIGTKFPLRLRLLFNKAEAKVVNHEGGKQSFTGKVASYEMFCENQIITDPVEQNIAAYLMFYGTDWHNEPAEVFVSEGSVEAIEFRSSPLKDHEQGFEIVGSLSGMFSSYYRWATSEEGVVQQTKIAIDPGSLGQLIPDNYQGQALPLWQIALQPA